MLLRQYRVWAQDLDVGNEPPFFYLIPPFNAELPFAYLRDISDTVRGNGEGSTSSTKAKADSGIAIGLSSGQHSDSVLLCGEDRIRTCGTV